MTLNFQHMSRARAAWKRYDHYRRLEEHGEPLPWHGRKAWRRVILTGLVLVVVAGVGLYVRYQEWSAPDATQIIHSATPADVAH